MRLAVVAVLLTHPLFFLTYILPAWIMFMFARYVFVVLHAPEKVPGMFTYMLFYEIFLYWMNIYALVTVKNKSWITISGACRWSRGNEEFSLRPSKAGSGAENRQGPKITINYQQARFS